MVFAVFGEIAAKQDPSPARPRSSAESGLPAKGRS